jgi:hypothetical protein
LSSATTIVTKRNIKAREKALALVLAELKRTPVGHPKRAFYEKKAKELMGEVAALKASIHYYKPSAQLAEDIKEKRIELAKLLNKAKKAKALHKKQLLRKAALVNRSLKEMLAAAQLKTQEIPVEPPALPVAPPVVSLEETATATSGDFSGPEDDGGSASHPDGAEEGPPNRTDGTVSGETFPEVPNLQVIQGGLSEVGQDLAHEISEIADKLDEIQLPGEDGDVPFYKHPLVAFGLGVVVGGIFINR